MFAFRLLRMLWMSVLVCLLYSQSTRADLAYGTLPGVLPVEQADHNRVPQVDFYVEPLSGSTMLAETDYVGEGQFPLKFVRYMSSPSTGYCQYGGGNHSYSSCIGGFIATIVRVHTMGFSIDFNYADFSPRTADLRDTLVRNGVINGKTYYYVYTEFKTGIREAYGTDGALIARFDRGGIEHRLNYTTTTSCGRQLQSVTHIPSGRSLTFKYSSNCATMTMTDPNNVSYQYSGATYIDSATYPIAKPGATALKQSYTYLPYAFANCFGIQSCYYLNTVKEGSTTLLSMPSMQTTVTNGIPSAPYYTSITRAGHNAKPLIQTRSYSGGLYNITNKFTDTDTSAYRALTTLRGVVITNGVPVPGTEIFRPSSVSTRCADCNDDYKSYGYNGKGDLTKRTDYLGRVTQFTNDPRGLPLTETEAFGTAEARTTTRTWDARFPLKTSETVGGITHEWRYDAKGHLVKDMTHPNTETLVNDSCVASSITCHETDYSYTYDPITNIVLRMVKTGPRLENGSTITDYQANGDLWKTTNALGQVDEVLAVNAHGQITQLRDINGQVTITDYNNLRQPITITTGSDVTRYDYYTNGRLSTLTHPDGSVLSYTYNLAGSVKTVSATNNGITETAEYQRDSRGKILNTIHSRTGDTAQTLNQTFDNKGLLGTVSDGSSAWSKALTYNLNNLQTQSCLSAQICDLTGYTGLDQVNDRSKAPLLSNGTLGAATPLLSLNYDGAGRVHQVTDPLNLTSVLTNNEINKHTDENSPDFGDRISTYDLAGNETYQQDSDGNAATKYYDALDRLTQINYSDGGAVSQIWDIPGINDNPAIPANNLGRLSGRTRTYSTAIGGLAVTDNFRYNVRGDIIGTEQQITGLPTLFTAASYGANSRRESLSYPNGLQIQYGYGSDGRIQQVNATLNGSTQTLASNITFQPLSNRLRSFAFGNGLSYWRDRDAGGRLSAIRVLNANQTVLDSNDVRYDARNRVSGYGTINFGYDDLDHLSSQTSTVNAQRTQIIHDNNGNLKQLDNYDTAGNLTRSDTLSVFDNRLTGESITPAPPGIGAWKLAYNFDLSGFVTGSGGYNYGYDAARTMTYFSQAAGREDYRYDAARRRVLKTNAAGQIRYVYDQADHLIYETDGNGKSRNYVWLGDIPLAVIDQNADGSLAAIYYIETDFTNTPRNLRRASGDLSKPVWNWPIAPYGDTPALEDPDGDGISVTLNLRYPGQYYDSFSGLHYNYTRYFTPRTGRYLQPDLIGLDGGTNVYTYANGNPVHYTDPTGTDATASISSLFESFSFESFMSSMANFFEGFSYEGAAGRIAAGTSAPALAIFVAVLPSSLGNDDETPFNGMLNEADTNGTDNADDTKPSLSDYKDALDKVHNEVGKLPKGEVGKFGSPQAGDSKKGYRLDPPHDGVAEGDAESKYHINWWDYTGGKKGKGGRYGAIPIGD